MKLVAAPVTLIEANRFVEVVHRHNGRLPAAKFAIAAADQETGQVHGIAIAGLPKARMLCDGYTLEVNRVCTDGARNACSFLYGCCIRAAKALGYRRLVTYTLRSEPGSSLKASGWRIVTGIHREGWTRRNGRDSFSAPDATVRWEVVLIGDGEGIALQWPAETSSRQEVLDFGEAA